MTWTETSRLVRAWKASRVNRSLGRLADRIAGSISRIRRDRTTGSAGPGGSRVLRWSGDVRRRLIGLATQGRPAPRNGSEAFWLPTGLGAGLLLLGLQGQPIGLGLVGLALLFFGVWGRSVPLDRVVETSRFIDAFDRTDSRRSPEDA